MLGLVDGALARLVSLALVAAPTAALARPYGVDDLLRTEAFGQILVAPGGRWLVFERQRPFAQSPRFEELSMDALRSQLFRVDLSNPGAAQPLLTRPATAGALIYGFSPRGSRIAVARLDGTSWQLGVVTVATGAVRWFDISPDYYPYRTTLGWMSEDRLLVIAQVGNTLPWVLRSNLDDIARLPAAWTAKQQGRVATVTMIASGRVPGESTPPARTHLLDLDLMTGTHRSLAEGDLQSLTVAPDGRHVALIEETDRIRIDTKEPLNSATDVRRRRMSVIDLITGRQWHPCESCDVPFAAPVWSPSGSKLLFFTRPAGQDWQQGRPWLADMADGQTQPVPLGSLQPVVTQSFGDYDRVGLGWLGALPMLFARPNDRQTSRADWYLLGGRDRRALTADVSEPSPQLVTQFHGKPVMLVDAQAWQITPTGVRRLLPATTNLAAAAASVMGAGREPLERPLFGWRTSDHARVVAMPGETGAEIALSGEGDQPQTISVEQNAVVVTRTHPNGVTDLAIQTRDRPAVVVASINQYLADVTATLPIPIHHRLPDGRDLTSWLYLPAAREDGARPGLITIPYAGRVFGDSPPRGWGPGDGRTYTNVAALVGHGYAVLLPSMPELAVRDDAPFDHAGQVLSAVDAVIATGAVDPDRLGLWGHSFGGYTAATIATETNRFKAIVASNGVYDLTSFQGSFTPAVRMAPGYNSGIVQWAGWTETGQPKLGATPWSNPARYSANSPIHHIDRIATPMMIIAADRDFVPLQQGEQLFSALYRQGKEAVLLSYWGEEHTLASPANIRDCYSRVFAWFDTHLGASEPPR